MDDVRRVLLVSAEVDPCAKVGGLGDVAAALPRALRAIGHDARVAMPAYPMALAGCAGPAKRTIEFEVDLRPGLRVASYAVETVLPTGVPIYLVGADRYFSHATDSARVYAMEPEPYLWFGRAVSDLVARLASTWAPDVIHANDWHTGMVPVYESMRRTSGQPCPATVFTIHNMAYRGEFGQECMSSGGIPPELFTYEGLEFHGRFSFIKGGMVFADQVNTVSPTYAREVSEPGFGMGLDGLVRHLLSHHRFRGILNGIDTEVSNPADDPCTPASFCAGDMAGKSECKRALQSELGLPTDQSVLLVGMVSRIAEQKGYDLVARAAQSLATEGLQLVILGIGEDQLVSELRAAADRDCGHMSVVTRFDAPLAQRIYAGSDVFLMPSRFEPCGLGQLIAMRYGSIPVVRSTGGLADTVRDADEDTSGGTGFTFHDASVEAMMDALKRARAAWCDHGRWAALVGRAMQQDLGWTRAAAEYVQMYNDAIALHGARLGTA